MRSSLFRPFAAAPLSAAFISIVTASAAVADGPAVVTDIAPIQSLVARVMEGTGATAQALVSPGVSPHDFAMKPSQARALARADLIVWIGEGLTPWLEDPLETLPQSALVLELLDTEGWTTRSSRQEVDFHDEHDDDDHSDEGHDDHDDHDDHGDDDHGDEDHDDHAEDDHDDHAEDDHGDHGDDDHAGHDHGDVDPHAWLDPTIAAVWAGSIAEALSDRDPENAALYAANAEAAAAEMLALSDEISAQLSGFDTPYLVAHDAYGYFEDRFGLTPEGAITLTDASEPGPRHVATLRAEARDGGIACIFADPASGDRWVNLVGEGTDLQIVTADPLGNDLEPGAALYPALLRDLAAAVAACQTAASGD